jgi:hypothetical protein
MRNSAATTISTMEIRVPLIGLLSCYRHMRSIESVSEPSWTYSLPSPQTTGAPSALVKTQKTGTWLGAAMSVHALFLDQNKVNGCVLWDPVSMDHSALDIPLEVYRHSILPMGIAVSHRRLGRCTSLLPREAYQSCLGGHLPAWTSGYYYSKCLLE